MKKNNNKSSRSVGYHSKSPDFNLMKVKKQKSSKTITIHIPNTENTSNIFAETIRFKNKKAKEHFFNFNYQHKSDFYNHEKAKITRLVRKKYTSIMKTSLQNNIQKESLTSTIKSKPPKIIRKIIMLLFQAIVSLISVILYIINTYYPEEKDTDDPHQINIIQGIRIGDYVIGVCIVIDYFIRLWLSNHRLTFVFKPLNIMDLLTLIPIIWNIFIQGTKSIGFIRIVRVMRIMKIFRVNKIIISSQRFYKENKNKEIKQRLILTLLSIVAVVFLSTGVVHFLTENFPSIFFMNITESEKYICESTGLTYSLQDLSPPNKDINMTLICNDEKGFVKMYPYITFDIALYYVITTMSTVGFGDIAPENTVMRIVVSALVIVSIISISQLEINDFLIINQQYNREYKTSSSTKHIILIGFFTKNSLNIFLNEFYHEDHKEKGLNMKIVIIQDNPPEKEIQSILLNPKYEDKLYYIIGSVFNEEILQLAKINSAKAIFIKSQDTIVNNLTEGTNDDYLILACKSISQYTHSPIFAQFNSSESLLHEWGDWDIAFSLQQIKMSIIIKNGFISGFATMIMNLISSISPYVYYKRTIQSPWMLEYLEGASQEIYIIKPPPDFEPINFAAFALKSYIDYGPLVIGITRKNKYIGECEIEYINYLLNPLNCMITKDDSVIIIAEDENEANSIFIPKKKSQEKTNDQKIEIKNVKNKESQSEDHRNDDNDIDEEFNAEEEERVQRRQQEEIQAEETDSTKLLLFRDYFRDENIMEQGYNKQSYDISPKNNNTSDNTFMAYCQNKKQKFKIWEHDRILSENLNNHYLVFCQEDQLWEFMACFTRYINSIIFFISDKPLTTSWEIIKTYYPNTICIESSYSDQDHLSKLRLISAKHVFILTSVVENSYVDDSAILPLVKIIEENYSQTKYTLELADELNVRYLTSKGIEEKTRRFDQKPKEKIDNRKQMKKAAKLPVKLWPKYAKSDIFFSSSLESLLAFAYHNEGTIDILLKMLSLDIPSAKSDEPTSPSKTASPSNQADIKENCAISIYRFIGDSHLRILFRQVFRFFIQLKPPVLPIAIYRVNTDETVLHNELPYIVTNPKQDLELNKLDQVICLGMTNKEDIEDLADYDLRHTFLERIDDSRENKDELSIYDEDQQTEREIVKEDFSKLNEEELLERLIKEFEFIKSNRNERKRKKTSAKRKNALDDDDNDDNNDEDEENNDDNDNNNENDENDNDNNNEKNDNDDDNDNNNDDNDNEMETIKLIPTILNLSHDKSELNCSDNNNSSFYAEKCNDIISLNNDQSKAIKIKFTHLSINTQEDFALGPSVHQLTFND